MGTKRIRGEEGTVLVVALLVMIILSGLGAALLTLAFNDTSLAFKEEALVRAAYIAEAGAHKAVDRLGASSSYTGEANTAFGAGTFTVTVSPVAGQPGRYTITSTGYVPSSAAPRGKRIVDLVVEVPSNFLKYGFSSTGNVFCDQIGFASQPGGKNDSYNGGPGVFKPTLTRGDYSGGNVPTGGGWSSAVPLSTPPDFPLIDFARYASSPTVVNMNAFRDANGVVNVTSVTNNTVYYIDGSFFIGNIGNNPTVTFIATHDIKNNATQGMRAVSGYPLFLAGGYIYMDTDNTSPLSGAIYSDGSHALAGDRTYPINPTWIGHGGTDLVYVESHSQIIGAVAARIPPGSGLRLFGGGGSTVTYDMNLLNGLANLYAAGGAGNLRIVSWWERGY